MRMVSILLLLSNCFLTGCSPRQQHLKMHPPGTFALLPGGSVRIGHPRSNDNPLRTIHLPSFQIGRHPVTIAEYAFYLNQTHATPPKAPHLVYNQNGYGPTPGFQHHPITCISFSDAKAYCRWYARWHHVPARLPTELEWEYAARGDIDQAPFPWGWGTPVHKAVWHTDSTRPVGSFSPNGFGLYDMSGNVWQWCTVGKFDCILRGGAWSEKEESMLTVFCRVQLPPSYAGADTGFRVLIESPPQ